FAQLDHEARHRRASPPLPQPGQDDTEHERSERRALSEPKPPVESVVGNKAPAEAVRVIGRDERQDAAAGTRTGAVKCRAAEVERTIRAIARALSARPATRPTRTPPRRARRRGRARS